MSTNPVITGEMGEVSKVHKAFLELHSKKAVQRHSPEQMA